MCYFGLSRFFDVVVNPPFFVPALLFVLKRLLPPIATPLAFFASNIYGNYFSTNKKRRRSDTDPGTLKIGFDGVNGPFHVPTEPQIHVEAAPKRQRTSNGRNDREGSNSNLSSEEGDVEEDSEGSEMDVDVDDEIDAESEADVESEEEEEGEAVDAEEVISQSKYDKLKGKYEKLKEKHKKSKQRSKKKLADLKVKLVEVKKQLEAVKSELSKQPASMSRQSLL